MNKIIRQRLPVIRNVRTNISAFSMELSEAAKTTSRRDEVGGYNGVKLHGGHKFGFGV